MAEAVGLVNTLDNWTAVDKLILSTKTPEKKKIFGKGNFLHLTGLRFSQRDYPLSLPSFQSVCMF